ncbi:1-phosphatidylinositol 4,5-bisphosphate phosphodiesterase gamma-1-like [Saccoglossus kowalevskii]|uniref:1-phosphatidylinositol 4,5-bisphosphate phosphodiesterase gamma n=1 Tax=Saccoglossus kowalevskii TaxID=10224 RepID=A0ABM0H1P8_SACKO|nr:PREDICTED: 1-phosphatidylinositol 4,5-bisphosphate phosphodiesterase gamma-1-like [Saccoglossus kowalevskii]
MAACALHNGEMSPHSPELNELLRKLELGVVMTKFFPKKRPEKRTFQVKLETRQIIWSRVLGRAEGAADIREIKEIRPGKNSRDFERWPDDARKIDSAMCFVIMYGNEFRLKILSCAAITPDACDMWMKGLAWLVKDTLNSCHLLMVERWLWKEFYSMDRNKSNSVTVKDLKSFLPRANCKISTTKLRELFKDVDTRKRGEIGFESFAAFYHELVHQPEIADRFVDFFSDGDKIVSLSDFLNFLRTEQKDPLANNVDAVKQFLHDFVEDPTRQVQEPYLTVKEFVDYIYSKQNTIWDSSQDVVCHDMDQPMSHYWIACSHNTYLTGDQYLSESSCEAYVRCLRMGCRCVELDCWDGPEGYPVIFHGHTLTSKIKFIDVIKTIKEHAFATSEYPVILSIENHCSLPQQRKMASAFQEVFGDMLLSQPIDRDATMLPSPNQLKRKVILKHKKLPEGASDTFSVSASYDTTVDDLSNSIKNGLLYLEDPMDAEWAPHFFVLTSNKIYYSEETETQNNQDDDDESTNGQSEGLSSDELHFSEKWFHGKLKQPRDTAEQLIVEYHEGDGTFLVRESDTFKGDFILSFWAKDKVNHCRIKSKQERGLTKYYLLDNLLFDSLYSLITHYRTYPLKSKDMEIVLTHSVPQPQSHENKDWYHNRLTRKDSENMMKRVHRDGAFLVRRSERIDYYAISFRAEGKIKHCRIKEEGRLFTIGTAQFESLVELVHYYEKHPLYRKMKLKYPVNQAIVDRIGMEPEEGAVYGVAGVYMDPNTFVAKVTVKALYDYRAQRDDELTFCKHAIITNVDKQDGGWWKGDYGGKKQMWFPSNYVEELEPLNSSMDSSTDSTPLGNLQKGVIDIQGCCIDIIPGGKGERRYVFRIMSPSQPIPLEVAADSEEEALSWQNSIRTAVEWAEKRDVDVRQHERNLRIAKEFSDLIVYCRSVPFKEDCIPGNYYEMSSFPETKVEKYVAKGKAALFTRYNKFQFSRVYPKGQRVDSSNYDPMPCWMCGSQMVALNYQTPDRPIQINAGRFLANGKCGMVLLPDCMRNIEGYDPTDKNILNGVVEPITITITIMGARHLIKTGRGIASPFVEVEIIGTDYDNHNKYKTKTKVDNGLNPVWMEVCEFDIINPPVAMIRFSVQDEDMFGDPNFLGQATYPISCIRNGYRSVPLCNGYSEELELGALLVHIEIRNAKEGEDGNIYASIQELRSRTQELSSRVVAYESGEPTANETAQYNAMSEELRAAQDRLFMLTEQRKNRHTIRNCPSRLRGYADAKFN